jgi:hypothetical protein
MDQFTNQFAQRQISKKKASSFIPQENLSICHKKNFDPKKGFKFHHAGLIRNLPSSNLSINGPRMLNLCMADMQRCSSRVVCNK